MRKSKGERGRRRKGRRTRRGRRRRRMRRMKKSQSPDRRTRGKATRQEDKERGKNKVSSLRDGRWEMGDRKEERQTDLL
jgi:hypothetical protein